MTFDLIGLPPTPEEVEGFLSHGENAYEAAVDRLLASPHYGERWARPWLDAARYAEDQAHIVGDNDSLTYPNAYRYRDWVIAALNSDMPYDRFVRLQLAADLVEPDDETNRAALGFIGLGPKYYRRNDLAVMADEWEDRVDTVSRGLLGLTVACARCHDHKFDPIPTEDYYALAGVFAGTEMFNRPLHGDVETGGDGAAKKPQDALHIVRDAKSPADLPVYVRGDVNHPGPTVPRHFLQVLSDGAPPTFARGSGRRELAEAIVDPRNPLAARVLVNRVWGRYFGRPLVGTPSNFGALGERPTHPELLDDLAVRFMEAGWSLKWLHREIALSAAYRQASTADATRIAADPDNLLLSRMNRRRLDVEAWRDELLAVAGRLDPAVGGPSIDVQDSEAARRTVYAAVSRLQLNPMLSLFDFPDPNAHADRRVQTTTALQKLFVLNSPFMVRQAEALAARLADDAPTSGDAESAARDRIQRAYLLLYGRAAEADETSAALAYLRPTESDAADRWEQYAQVLLATNEAAFID